MGLVPAKAPISHGGGCVSFVLSVIYTLNKRLKHTLNNVILDNLVL